MMRVLSVLTLLLLGACGHSTGPEAGARAAEGPIVSIGGSARAYYGIARQ